MLSCYITIHIHIIVLTLGIKWNDDDIICFVQINNYRTSDLVDSSAGLNLDSGLLGNLCFCLMVKKSQKTSIAHSLITYHTTLRMIYIVLRYSPQFMQNNGDDNCDRHQHQRTNGHHGVQYVICYKPGKIGLHFFFFSW